MSDKSEKIVQINPDVAKKKLKQASSKAATAAGEKLHVAKDKIAAEVKSRKDVIAEKVGERKDRALSRLLDKGMDLTRKQLKMLQGLKKKAK